MRSTQHVTKSRLLVSTPEGNDGAYYRAMHEPSNMIKLVLDWKDNPWQNRGLYRHVGGRMEAIDPVNNPLPPGYEEKSREKMGRLRERGFKLSGEIRSPWYDDECDRTNATPQTIAKELDRDYGGSMYRIFGREFFDAVDKTVQPPRIRGALDFNPETLEATFSTEPEGPLMLWCPLDSRSRPPRHSYIIGCDVCSGLGGSFTSNSALEVIDATTMEQVGEFAVNTMEPRDFADFAIALCKLFHNAYLIWEHNGPGAAFTAQVKARGYPNFFMRQVEWNRGKKKTKQMGWWTDGRTKEKMFSALSAAVKTGELAIRSTNLKTECGQYVRINGKIDHAGAEALRDDSSRGEAHGDRAIAFCVCLQGVRDRPANATVKQPDEELEGEPPPFTMAHRFREYLDGKKEPDGWDDRSTRDLMLLGGGQCGGE